MTLFHKLIKPAAVAVITVGIAVTAQAQPIAAADSAFYIQVNLDEMRQSPSGSQLYAWVEDEVLEEIEEEFGANFTQSLDGISIFGAGEEQTPVVLLHGFLSQQARDAITDELFEGNQAEFTESRYGQEFFAIDGDGEFANGNIQFDGDEFDHLFLAFGDAGQTLVTPSEQALDEFLSNGAAFHGALSPDLIVVQATRPLVQGGLNTKHSVFKHGPWESKFFQNVEQLGLVIADANDGFDIRAQAVSRTAAMAEAMGGIAKGLLSFKALADDGDDDMVWLENLEVSTQDNVTTFQLQIPAEHLLDAID